MIPRRATLAHQGKNPETRLLSDWGILDAYVLLGEPGSGKSVALEMEHLADPDNTIFVTARDFATLGVPSGSETKTILIDALDERRASAYDTSHPLDEIRKGLNALGRPRFRLACREADWNSTDTDDLKAIAPGGLVFELRLNPLSITEIRSLLLARSATQDDPDDFIAKARQRGLDGLLANPLLLDLLVNAVQGGSWPANRSETYILACRQLATEHNGKHSKALQQAGSNLEQILNDAGVLCALHLLSDSARFVTEGPAKNQGEIGTDAIPSSLGIPVERVKNALSSKLFAAEGEHRTYRHRTIAEFLGAQALAGLIVKGLPVGRVISLMCGFDGRVVEPLRGLFAWTASCSQQARGRLIERDPLGLVLYGDVQPFTKTEKMMVFDAFLIEAKRYLWFRNESWESHLFGALGTVDMAPWFEEMLASASHDDTHEVLLDCICDAISHGEAMPQLSQVLDQVIRNAEHWPRVRVAAMDALNQQLPSAAPFIKKLIDDISSSAVQDSDDELLGHALTTLYPSNISLPQLFACLHARKQESLIGRYHMFWAYDLASKTKDKDLADLMDAIFDYLAGTDDETKAFAFGTIVDSLLPRALERIGPNTSSVQLLKWLHAAIGDHGEPTVDFRAVSSIRDWFNANPEKQKAVFSQALSDRGGKGPLDRRDSWLIEQLLFGAARPNDWYKWLLDLADKTAIECVARLCVEDAAFAAMELSHRFDISINDVVDWINAHKSRWANCGEWTSAAWKCELDDWRHQESKRNNTEERRRAAERDERQKNIEPHRLGCEAGTAVPRVMYDMAMAYSGKMARIQGETPVERISDFIGQDCEAALRIIDGIRSVLKRNDLPTSTQILDLAATGSFPFLRAPCLLAADLLEEERAGACESWDTPLARTMTAFYLTSYHENAAWYERLSNMRADAIADVVVAYNDRALQSDHVGLRGLQVFEKGNKAKGLAQRILPALLNSMPEVANSSQLRELIYTLLPAASKHLDRATLEAICKSKLEKSSLDTNQRIAFLAIGLKFDWAQVIVDLRSEVGGAPERVIALADTLNSQLAREAEPLVLNPQALGSLVEMMSPEVDPDLNPEKEFSDSRSGDVIRALIGRLAANTDPAAAAEFERLLNLPSMSRWTSIIQARQQDQARAARSAAFRFAGVDGVARTLSNSTPANAPDMIALLIDQLTDLAILIRYDEANRLNLFWRESASGMGNPRIENDCRDVLHGMLRDRMLHFGVQIEKETHHAGDTRCDLTASMVIGGERLAIPIEIKKDNHGKIWQAWKTQLIDLYGAHPSAGGLGIYLVLWFGSKTTRSPNGALPKNGEQMAQELTKCIDASYWPRFSGLVMDLSKRC